MEPIREFRACSYIAEYVASQLVQHSKALHAMWIFACSNINLVYAPLAYIVADYHKILSAVSVSFIGFL